MNKIELLMSRNRIAELVRQSNRCGSHRNCVRMNPGSTLEHEMTKARLVFMLIAQGHEVITEAIFTDGGRADVLDLDTATAYEIVCSEELASLERKAERYPEALDIVAVEPISSAHIYKSLDHSAFKERTIRRRNAIW